MTRTLPLASALLLGTLAASLGGCSSGPSSLPVDDLPSAVGDAICTQLLTCAEARSGSGEISLLVLSPTFAELCPQLLGSARGSLDYLVDAVDSQRVVYDGAAARRCIDEITSSCTIEAGLEFFPSCRAAIVGQVALGESCSLKEECVPGAHCEATLMGSTCSGTCVARLPLGSLCDSAGACALPEGVGIAECRTNGGADRVCVALQLNVDLQEGALCGGVDTTGLERAYGLCAGDFFCFDPDDDGEGVCTRALADGALCEYGMACQEGSLCLPDGMMNAFCTPVTVVTTVGGACDDVSTLCDYPGRLQCVGGTCAAIPAGTCYETYHCDEGEYCDDTTDTCEARKALGSECNGSSECVSDNCRDDGTMTATRRCIEPEVRCG